MQYLLRIRIELIGVSPPIWREILVPARYSIWDLHVAIQDAMGWLDYHLHEFRIGGSSRDCPPQLRGTYYVQLFTGSLHPITEQYGDPRTYGLEVTYEH